MLEYLNCLNFKLIKQKFVEKFYICKFKKVDVETQKSKLIVAVREHNQLGYIFSLYEVENSNEEFLKVIHPVSKSDYFANPTKYSEKEKNLIELVDKISDTSIYKNFNTDKRLSITEFFTFMPENIKNNFVRPYIEKIALKIFNFLVENPDIEIYFKYKNYENIYKSDKCICSKDPAKVIFNFSRNEKGIKYWLTVYHKDHEIVIFKKKPIILSVNPGIIELEHKIMRIEESDANKLKPFYESEYIEVPKNLEINYAKNFISKALANFQVKIYDINVIEKEILPEVNLILDYDRVNLNLLLEFRYDKYSVKFEDEFKYFVSFDDKKFEFTKIKRNFVYEKEVLQKIKDLGLSYQNNRLYLQEDTYHSNNLISWINSNYEKLKNIGVEVIKTSAISNNYYLKSVQVNLKIDDKIDWFDIEGYIEVENYKIPFYKIRENIVKNLREYKLEDGQILILPEYLFKNYSNLFKFSKKTTSNTLKINKLHVAALYSQHLQTSQLLNNEKLLKIKEFIANPLKNSYKTPVNLKSTLRNYQKIGFNWLMNLYQNSLGGILADDMGLGKTVQVLSLIQKVIENNVEAKPNLIIVPRSLLHNWMNETQKHTKLKSFLYFGLDRKSFLSHINTFDIIITSYGIARNDIEILKNINFNIIILDESQYVKNSKSKTYQAIKFLNSKTKIALTGTPIENSLRDLWTQMNYVNPGLLGTYNFFKEYYLTPIEKSKNNQVKEELKGLIAPFILRRTKLEVEKDLPQLIIQDIYCEMTPEQKMYYYTEKSALRNAIQKLYEEGKLIESKIVVLQALTKLRQISNHPRLVDSNYYHSSGKFEEIINRIKTVISEGHKVLVFSTFVKFLELFEEELTKNNIDYQMLTGQSVDRQKIVNEFENNQNIKVFLISMKAGGFGLNLVSADYVFLVDPWWNPAVEQQAIARAHRIGQTKNVFAFRFITFGSVEQKIQLLQQKKQEISDEFINENNYFKYIKEEEIVKIFE